MKEKTSLVNLTTVGLENAFNVFQLSDGSLVHVTIVDTAGQEKYRSLSDRYYRKADGCLLVYDITDKRTFEEMEGYFYTQLKDKCKKNIKVIVLGNKTDLEENRKVSREEGADFAQEKGYMFMETSCKNTRTVADSFETLIELTYAEFLEKGGIVPEKSSITINKANATAKNDNSGCPC